MSLFEKVTAGFVLICVVAFSLWYLPSALQHAPGSAEETADDPQRPARGERPTATSNGGESPTALSPANQSSAQFEVELEKIELAELGFMESWPRTIISFRVRLKPDARPLRALKGTVRILDVFGEQRANLAFERANLWEPGEWIEISERWGITNDEDRRWLTTAPLKDLSARMVVHAIRFHE